MAKKKMVIIDLKIPKTCSDCPMCYDNFKCSCTDTGFFHCDTPEGFDFCEERLPNCPLKELGTCLNCTYSRPTLIVPEERYCNSLDAYVPKDFFCAHWEKDTHKKGRKE